MKNKFRYSRVECVPVHVCPCTCACVCVCARVRSQLYMERKRLRVFSNDILSKPKHLKNRSILKNSTPHVYLLPVITIDSNRVYNLNGCARYFTLVQGSIQNWWYLDILKAKNFVYMPRKLYTLVEIKIKIIKRKLCFLQLWYPPINFWF